MAKVVIVMEDLSSDDPGMVDFQWNVDFGNGDEPLPEDQNDLTPCQELGRNFANVLMGMSNPAHMQRMKAEVEAAERAGQIVVPEHIARGEG